MATTIPLTSTITPTTNLTPLIDLSQTTTDVERFGDLYTPLARQVPLVPYRMTFKQAYYRHYLPVRLDERVMRSYQDMNPETRASLFPHHSTEWLPPQDCADEVVVAQRLVAIARLDPEHTQLLLFQGGLWLIAGPTTTANTLLDLMAEWKAAKRPQTYLPDSSFQRQQQRLAQTQALAAERGALAEFLGDRKQIDLADLATVLRIGCLMLLRYDDTATRQLIIDALARLDINCQTLTNSQQLISDGNLSLSGVEAKLLFLAGRLARHARSTDPRSEDMVHQRIGHILGV